MATAKKTTSKKSAAAKKPKGDIKPTVKPPGGVATPKPKPKKKGK